MLRINKHARNIALILAFVATSAVAAIATGSTKNESRTPVWRQDFETMPTNWDVRTKPGVSPAIFTITTNSTNACLQMVADGGSATLSAELKGVDLRKTPVMRWRWRVLKLPDGADGRYSKKDDQAIGLYITTGTIIQQKSVAYRWETATPIGDEGDALYGGGVVRIHWFCLRNSNDNKVGSFVVEQRNVADDFRKAYGFVPDKVGLGISCNSQYTSSHAEAQLDWVEFISEEDAKNNQPVTQ